MSIHVYIWLCIENEEEVSVEEEETAPPTETPPAENSFIFENIPFHLKHHLLLKTKHFCFLKQD